MTSPGRIPFIAALPPLVTLLTFNGWLKSMPPAIEKPHGAPPVSVILNAAIFLFYKMYFKFLWKAKM